VTKHILLDGPVIPPAHFPHAQSQRLEQAPDRCDRCGGIWREVSDGYQCRQCPRRWLVGERLAAMLCRTRETEAAGRRIAAPKGR
jgi:DNA-directed RNA polymerase subunit RPC12/RpoP